MPKIINERYRAFKENGTIEIISSEKFAEMLDKIDYKVNPTMTKQGRALAILAFYSGLRPTELVKIKPTDIEQTKNFLKLKFCANKKGRFSTVWLPLNYQLQEFWDYAKKGLPNFPVFYLFNNPSPNKVKYVLKRTKETKQKTYSRLSYRVNYLFKTFFDLPPYFFRHNAFSALADLGATDRQLMQAKGAASYQSIQPYVHLSQEQGIKLAKIQKKR